MKKLGLALLVLAVAAGCGDDAGVQPDAPPDLPPDAPVDLTFTPGCDEVPQVDANAFDDAGDFGPVAAGSLAAWQPDGRWFLTGTRVGGVSSFHFEVRGNEVIVDRDTGNPGTLTADALFQRTTFDNGMGDSFVIAKRVANLLPDGSLRADRAVCDGATCRVCRAVMVRAAFNAGEGEADKLVRVGELRGANWEPGYTFNVRVAGTLAYVIRQDGLHIVETSDPANPVELGSYRRNGDGYSNDVKIVDAANGRRFALIADFPVDIVDVTNPAAPTLAGQIPEEAHTLFTETRNGSTRAYFGNYDGSCPVYDVTNPAAPVRLGRFMTQGPFVHDLSVADGIAYLNAWDAGLVVVDFNDPANPVQKGAWVTTPTSTSHSNWTTRVGGRHLAIHGEESYGAHLNVVDLDPGPTFMQPIGEWKTRDHVSIHNIMAFGSKAYFSHYQDGIRVVDLSNPAQPTTVGYFNTWDPQGAEASNQFFEGAVGLDVDLTRKLIFVADSPRGLIILRDDTP